MSCSQRGGWQRRNCQPDGSDVVLTMSVPFKYYIRRCGWPLTLTRLCGVVVERFQRCVLSLLLFVAWVSWRGNGNGNNRLFWITQNQQMSTKKPSVRR